MCSSGTPVYTVHDKAFYADANLVDFVRPGLVVKITSAEIAQDGTIRARLRLTDPRGLPLDREGVTTPGTIAVSLVAAHIPHGAEQYVAYTTRPQTSPITNQTAVQAAADTGGRFERAGEGEYVYTFGTRAANADRSETHSIGVYGSRDLTDFDLGTQFDDDVFTFVPDGSQPREVRDVIRTETCNKCHDPLQAHGGARRSMELCVLCHTPQSADPDTGNTVDMPVMIHKIHMGRELPSVQAGQPYRIIGFQQQVNDFSNVGFPTETHNCQMCHEPGPAQANKWLEPARKDCGSCHDNVNFATGEGHVNLPQVSDAQCGACHVAQGDEEFDVSIVGAHTIPRLSRQLPGVVFTLEGVANAGPGRAPAVTFTVKDKSGRPIQPPDLSTLNLVLAGPTTDYASFVSEDARRASGGTDGRYTYTFQRALPDDARGTYAVGIEGYRNVTLMPGTRKEQVVRDVGFNQVLYFAVDGSQARPRRQVVTQAKCNSCHFQLNAHGTFRQNVEYCVLCHNPNATDQARRPASEMPPESIAFRTLVHKIHTGEELQTPYVVYGFGAERHDFSEVRFPGDRRDCDKCHVNDSQQLPLPEGLLPVQNPRGFIHPEGPATAACLGCHTGREAAAHAAINTSERLGESCSVCHGRNAEISVNRAHAR